MNDGAAAAAPASAGDGASTEAAGGGRLFGDLDARILVDTSESKPVHLLVTRGGAYIRLSQSALVLLRHVQGGATFEQIAEILRRRGEERNKAVTAADVEAAYQRLLGRIVAIDKSAGGQRGGFWFRRRLIPEPMVARIARRGAVLYNPVVAVCVSLAAAVGMLVYARGLPDSAGHFWPAYGLFVLSLLLHELGHASACARHGAQPSEIGFTFYLIYPAFYSNVTSAWTLKRWQRVVVDLGGVYFQMFAAAIYAAAYALTHWEPLRAALLMIGGSCLFSLNPILKLDGYWLVADALGVTNLGQQPVRLIRKAVNRLRGRASKPLPWSPAITVTLSLYSVASFVFWGYFMWRMLPFLGAMGGEYASLSRTLLHALSEAPRAVERAVLMRFLASTYVLLFVVVLSLRLLRSLLVKLSTRVSAARAARGNPRAAPLEQEPPADLAPPAR